MKKVFLRMAERLFCPENKKWQGWQESNPH